MTIAGHFFSVDAWTILGFFSQFLFFLSFVLQWYKSEKLKSSYLPLEFWWIRLVASVLMLIYSFHRHDLVFFITTIVQIFIYFRNIHISKKKYV